MKRVIVTIGTLVGLSCVAMVGVAVWRSVYEPPGSPAFVRRVAATINSRAPMYPADDVELTSAAATSAGLVIRYKLLEVHSAEVEREDIERWRAHLINRGCDDNRLRKIIDGGLTLTAVLNDQDGKRIDLYEIGRWDCTTTVR